MNEEMREALEELLYNENRTPNQPPWFLVHENDSVAERWSRVAKEILSLETDTHKIAVVKKGEPPLISEVHTEGCRACFASAQRSSDIEYYKGE